MPASTITIRELNEHDTEGFLALKRRGLATNAESFVATLADDAPAYPDSVRERLRRASVQGGDIVLGAFAPELIGIIAITRDQRNKRRHKADLHGMYVVPDRRRQGLGRMLLTRSLDMARSMTGLEETQLIVAAQNREAVALYERYGFVHVWKERHALKIGDSYVDAHHMILAVSAQENGFTTRSAPDIPAGIRAAE